MKDEEFITNFDSNSILFINCSVQGEIKYISENIISYFQKSPQYFLGKNIFDLLQPAKADLVKENFEYLIKTGKESSFLLPLKNVSGQELLFSVYIRHKQESGVMGLLLPLKNHTDNNQKNLFRQIEVMRTTLQSMDDVVFVLDKKGRFSELYRDEEERLFPVGINPSFIVGSNLTEAGFPSDVALLFLDALEDCESKNKTQQINYSIKAFGGEFYYQAKLSPRYTIENKFDGVTVVIRDISSMVKSEKQVKDSLDFYLKVLDYFPNPIWRCNSLKKFDYFNKKWVEFTGRDAQKEAGTGWYEGIHPHDKDRVIAEINSRFIEHKPFSIEYRLVHVSGTYRCVKNYCQPLFDLKGIFNGYMGSCFDIDEIRNTQNLLQESESRYKAMVQDQNDLVVRWKPDHAITFVNTSFRKFFNKTEKDLLGKDWTRLFKHSDREQIISKIDQWIRYKETGVFETELLSSNEERKYYQWLNSPIFNKAGKISEVQSVGRDITAIVEKENENQELLVRLNEKVKELSLLYGLSQHINQNMKPDQLFSVLTDEISRSFLNPKTTFTCIRYGDKEYKCQKFRIPAKSTLMSFPFGMDNIGVIEVYRDEKVASHPLIDYIEENERVLLSAVCDMLGTYLTKIETEEKLRHSETRFKELFDNVLDIVFKTDADGVLLQVNAAASKTLGYDSFVGESIWKFVLPIERHLNKEKIKELIASGKPSFTFETRMLSKSGEIIFFQIGGIIKYSPRMKPIEIFGVARDVTQQRKLEQSFMKTIINTEEKERKRFAEDLHDGIGPLLSGIKMYLQQESLNRNMDDNQQKVLNYCRELVNDAINQIRSIANNITPNVLNDFGLEKALNSHIAKINLVSSFAIDLKIKVPLDVVESELSVAVFRIVNELINNALKHAECTLVEISIDIRKNILSLFYRDNGKGFDIKNPVSETSGTQMGINNIYNRIHSLNGTISITSNPGEGVLIKIFVPVK